MTGNFKCECLADAFPIETEIQIDPNLQTVERT